MKKRWIFGNLALVAVFLVGLVCANLAVAQEPPAATPTADLHYLNQAQPGGVPINATPAEVVPPMDAAAHAEMAPAAAAPVEAVLTETPTDAVSEEDIPAVVAAPPCDVNSTPSCTRIYIPVMVRNSEGAPSEAQALSWRATVIAFATRIAQQPRTPTPVRPRPTATTRPGATATRPVPTATPRPGATATSMPAGPTPTPNPHAGMGKCGEPMDRWHAPIYNGCATGYELGDEPPAWVWASPKKPIYDGNHSTSAAENTTKHVFMKGYSFKDEVKSCIEIYVIQHGGSMGMERIARFHSTQFWIKDCSGAVSYGSMWTDFGVPTQYPAGDRVPTENFDAIHQERANKGIIRIDRSPSPTCEQWYGAVFGNRPDVSLLICGSVESYNDGEQNNPSGEYDPANWQLTGGLGLFRQYDFVWPLERMVAGSYTTDQFGKPVGACTGNTTYDGTSYPIQCQAWVMQPSLLADVNSKQPDFGFKRIFAIYRNENIPGAGVMAPN